MLTERERGVERVIKYLVDNGILKQEQIRELHGYNRKEDHNGKLHIINKHEYYNEPDDSKHDEIKLVIFTKSLTTGCDI